MTDDQYERLVDLTTERVAEQVNALHDQPSECLMALAPLLAMMCDLPPFKEMIMGMYPDATTILN
jgi:hypothetical protein